METKKLTPEEKLQKIIDYINENKSDYINVNILMEIIDNESTLFKRQSKLFIPGEKFSEFHEDYEYKENYIS